MAQKRQLSQIALDHLAGVAQAANEARQRAAELIAFANEQDAKIKEAMGDKEEATIFGVPYFTYTKKDAFRWAEFREAHPHVHRQYLEPVTSLELNKEKLRAEQADLLAEFQTREFRRVSRQPGT